MKEKNTKPQLIDANELVTKLTMDAPVLGVEGALANAWVYATIMSMRPVDAAPVRYGRWIKPTGMMPPEYHGHYECNLCGGWAMRDWKNPLTSVVLSDYCPHCGAVMRGQKDEAG